MSSLNRVFLLGNLTRDPEVRYTPSARAVADLRLAVNRTYKTADGEAKEETCFVGVVVWGKQAEACGQYLTKGAPVLVEGRLQYDEWEKDGQKFNRLRVVADRVQFMGRPKGAEFRDGDEGTPAPKDKPAPEEPATGGDPAGGTEPADEDNLPF